MKFIFFVCVAFIAPAFIQAELDPLLALPYEVKGGEGRVIEGWPAEENQFPYQVNLRLTRSTGTVACGGTLIARDVVLTAAHCVISASSVVVRYGGVIFNQMRQVTSTVMKYHPQYDANSLNNDIAYIKLPVSLEISASVQVIALPRRSQLSETYVNRVATVSGWGATVNGGGVTNEMRFVNLTVITNQRCIQDYSPVFIIASTICGVGIQSTAQSSCSGDSGGGFALVDTDGTLVQVGVVSFVSGLGCSANRAAGFVRPQFFWDWLNSETGIPIRP